MKRGMRRTTGPQDNGAETQDNIRHRQHTGPLDSTADYNSA